MTLQEAIYETIHHGKKPLKSIAADLEMKENNLTQIGLEYPTSNLWAKRIPPLIKSSEVYLILDVLEHQVGRIGITIPNTTEKTTSDIFRLTMKSMTEFGELIKEIEKSLKNDDSIDTNESKKINAKGWKAIQDILSLMATCKKSGDK